MTQLNSFIDIYKIDFKFIPKQSKFLIEPNLDFDFIKDKSQSEFLKSTFQSLINTKDKVLEIKYYGRLFDDLKQLSKKNPDSLFVFHIVKLNTYGKMTEHFLHLQNGKIYISALKTPNVKIELVKGF